MSNSAGFTIPVHSNANPVDRSAETVEVDVNAVHSFWFGRGRWLAGISMCVQGSVLLGAGVFLLTQISSTPNLVVQVALVGGLLTIGGIALLFRSLGDFRVGLKVDSTGLRARLGWSGFTVPWSRVERWSVSDRKRRLSELPGITIWGAGSQRLFTIPDGYLDDKNRREIRHVFRALAYEKEAAESPVNGG
jgi:hypothetical protein